MSIVAGRSDDSWLMILHNHGSWLMPPPSHEPWVMWLMISYQYHASWTMISETITPVILSLMNRVSWAEYSLNPDPWTMIHAQPIHPHQLMLMQHTCINLM